MTEFDLDASGGVATELAELEQVLSTEEAPADQHPLLADYPGLKSCAETFGIIIANLNATASMTLTEEERAEVPAGRSQVRQLRNITQNSASLDLICSRIILEADDEMAARQQIRSIMTSVLGNQVVTRRYTEKMIEYTGRYADTIRQFDNSSNPVMSRVRINLASGDREVTFDLLKQLAKAGDESAENDDRAYRTALGAAIDLQDPALLPRIGRQAEAGEFDDLIARDILLALGTASPENKVNPGRLAEFVHFMSTFTGEPVTTEFCDRLVRSWQNGDWPSALHHSLNTLVKGYILSYDDMVQAIHRAVSVIFRGNGADPLDQLMNELNGYRMLVQGKQPTIRRGMTYSITGPAVNTAAIARASVTSRRRQRQQAAERAAQAVDEQAQEAREPFTLHAIRTTDGELFEQDHDQFTHVKTDFLGRQPSAVLVEDLDRILTYMSEQLDFSHGNAAGVQKIKQPLRTSTGIHDVYEFKPKIVHGLSLISEKAKNIRVLFVMPGDRQLGLLSIIDRKQLVTELKRLGLGSAG